MMLDSPKHSVSGESTVRDDDSEHMSCQGEDQGTSENEDDDELLDELFQEILEEEDKKEEDEQDDEDSGHVTDEIEDEDQPSETDGLSLNVFDMTAKHKVPSGGASGELARVYEKGGEGINKPMDLGKCSGSERLILPPMNRELGEKLYRGEYGKAKTFTTASQMMAKNLSASYGQHDTAQFRAWVDIDGKLKQPHKFLPSSEEMYEQTKIDNFSVKAAPAGNKNPRGHLYGYMNALGLERSDRSRTNQDHLKYKVISKTEKNAEYLVKTANLHLCDIEFVWEFLRITCTWKHDGRVTVDDDSGKHKLEKHLKEKFRDCIQRLGCGENINEAIKHALRLDLIDIDPFTNLHGTLNSDQYKQNLLSAGHEVKHKHKCGKNTVKTTWIETAPGLKKQIKAYNKFIETLEQDSVRNSIGSKVGKLLNASTSDLQTDMFNSMFYQHGITRYD
jgi:hypothetical protein